MDEPVRWVTKAEAAQELEISLSTLNRKIRMGEIEVVREGRRVFVRMRGPEYLSDEELLRRAIAREHELERTVRELERNASELKLRASELERERDKARESSSAGRRPYEELEEAYRKGDRRAQGDEGGGHHAPRDRYRAAGAAGRQRSPVAVCAEVGVCPDTPRMSASAPSPISVYTPLTAIGGQSDGRTWAAVPFNAPGTRAVLEVLGDRLRDPERPDIKPRNVVDVSPRHDLDEGCLNASQRAEDASDSRKTATSCTPLQSRFPGPNVIEDAATTDLPMAFPTFGDVIAVRNAPFLKVFTVHLL